jgi:conjugal transfer pilus assembly protein TraD
MIINYQNLFRPTYEARAATAWGVSLAAMTGIALGSDVHTTAFVWMGAGSAAMALWRGKQTQTIWSFKANLAGKPFQFLKADVVRVNLPKFGDNLWLGWGYRWEPSHTQQATEIMKRDLEAVYPPKWFLKMRGLKGSQLDPKNAKGLQWIHGLDEESDMLMPLSAMQGHTAVLATTGAIKTTLYSLLVYQLALRGYTIVIIDPKGDHDLKEIAKNAGALSGRPEKVISFHPAFPSESVRIDTLKNWDRETQVASRISSLIPSDGDESFRSFVWMQVNHVAQAQIYIGIRPSWSSLLDAIQNLNGAQKLLEKALRKFFTLHVPGWEVQTAPLVSKYNKPDKKNSDMEGASPELRAYVEYFESDAIAESLRPRQIKGLISTVRSNREWFAKMMVLLLPLLTKLTAGELEGLLSPDYDNIDDPRPIFDTKKIVDGGYIFYAGLDSLSDPEVGSAIAAALLSDMQAVAGERYNYEHKNLREKARVVVLIDEWGDVMCEPVIQQLNKGRGAGLDIIACGQTFSDLVDKLGSQDKAKRMIGNFNNLIAGATQDEETQKIIAEKIGQTYIKKISRSHGRNSKTEDHGLEFGGSVSETVSEEEVDLFPITLMSKLPDLHYMAVWNRGTVIKGRIPKLVL